jgi:hypothetical protein
LAESHHSETGNWPTFKSGVVRDKPDESWSAIQSALVGGSRGLAGGSSIERLLYEKLRVVGVLAGLTLSHKIVVELAIKNFQVTGSWPTAKSKWLVEEKIVGQP